MCVSAHGDVIEWVRSAGTAPNILCVDRGRGQPNAQRHSCVWSVCACGRGGSLLPVTVTVLSSRAVCAVRWPQAGAVQLYWKTIRVIDLMWLRSCAPPPRHGYRYCDLVQLRVYELYRITACLYESPSPGPPQLPAVPSGAASRSAAFSERRPRLDIAPSNWRGTRSARPTQRSAAS